MTESEMFENFENEQMEALVQQMGDQLVGLVLFTAATTEVTDDAIRAFSGLMSEAVWTFHRLTDFTLPDEAAVASIGAMGSILINILPGE